MWKMSRTNLSPSVIGIGESGPRSIGSVGDVHPKDAATDNISRVPRNLRDFFLLNALHFNDFI